MYYGNGDSFVFSVTPIMKVYHWTEANNYFIISHLTTLGIGGGGEGFAFELDDTLDKGVSNRSATYDNDRLSGKEFFKCINVELWTIEGL